MLALENKPESLPKEPEVDFSALLAQSSANLKKEFEALMKNQED